MKPRMIVFLADHNRSERPGPRCYFAGQAQTRGWENRPEIRLSLLSCLMDKDEAHPDDVEPRVEFADGLPVPKELMIHILCFLIPSSLGRCRAAGEDEQQHEELRASTPTERKPPPRLEDGVRWVFMGAGLVCRAWHHHLTGHPGGRPLCIELWRQLALACGFWPPGDAPLPPSIDRDQEDWRQFFIRGKPASLYITQHLGPGSLVTDGISWSVCTRQSASRTGRGVQQGRWASSGQSWARPSFC